MFGARLTFGSVTGSILNTLDRGYRHTAPG